MRYIKDKDNNWHDIKNELPSSTTDVEFLNNAGEVISNGHIVIEMSGAYAALKIDIGYTWDSFDNYKYWRFK